MSNIITSGIHDMPFNDYLRHPAWGSSSIRSARTSNPATAKWKRENGSDSTQATIFGTAAHCAILTPDLFDQQIAVKPEGMTFQSNANKAIRDAWISEGRQIMSAEDHRKVMSVVDAFWSKSAAHESLANAVAREQSVFWQCNESNLLRKCRPDWYDESIVYDLKVTVDATKSLERLMYCVHANGWANQLANNRAGLNANGCNIKEGRLVIIAPSPPHETQVWLLRLREADCDFLELENENTCRVIAECERTGNWPGTPEQWVDIDLPMSATWTELEVEDLEESE